MKLTNRGIQAIYFITTLFLIGLSIFIYSLINQLINTAFAINENTKVSIELDRMMDNLRDAQSAQREYLASHDSVFLLALDHSLKEYPQHLLNVEQLLPESDFKRQQFTRITQLAKQREEYFLRILALDKVRPITNSDTRPGSQAADTLRFEVTRFKSLESSVIQQRNQLLEYHSAYTPVIFLILGLIALTLLLYFYLQLNRSFHRTSQLQNAMKNLVTDSSIAVCVFEGAGSVVTIANHRYQHIVQKADLTGKTIIEAAPDYTGFENFIESVKTVYAKGIPIEEKEKKVIIPTKTISETHYYNCSFRPYHGERGEILGVIFQAIDVSEQILVRIQIEENGKQLSIAIAAGELGTFDFSAAEQKLTWSDKSKQLFGLNADEDMSLEKYKSILHPDNKNTMQMVLSSLKENGGTYDIEYRILYKGDHIRWIRSKGIAQFDVNENPTRFTGVIQDITQRKENEAILKENEHRFRLLAETLPQLVWMTDEKGINKYTSQRWQEYTGIIPQAESEWAAVVHPDDLQAINTIWAECLRTGSEYKYDVRLRTKTGKFRWFRVNAVPVRNDKNEIKNWVGAFTDIHSEKEFTQELEENVKQRTHELHLKNEELNKINTELESFTYIASHDLQEPVRKIMILTNLLQETEADRLSEEGSKHFEKLYRGTERIKRLIEDILAFSQISNQERVFEKIFLSDLVMQVTSELSEQIEAKKARVSVSGSQDITVIVSQFHQLFINLIGNSLKFSRPEITPEVTITIAELPHTRAAQNKDVPPVLVQSIIESGNDFYIISVADNGIGFDPQYSEQIFKMFAKLHNRNQFAGTGIGLAFVKKIVENHKGYITTYSEQGNGCRFDIYIPKEAASV